MNSTRPLLLRAAALALAAAFLLAGAARLSASDADTLIRWLLDEERELKGIPFSEVVLAATGRKIIPVDSNNPDQRALLAKIGGALDRVLSRVNVSSSPVQRERRINEASAYFESAIREELNRVPGFQCTFPKTAAGRGQRSGYPDLRLVDAATGSVVYLDPKLYESGGRESSFRSFYFEPKRETNKINDDAIHLIVGIEHEARRNGSWRFARWELVDLSHFRVRLKAEFQASNRDLYQPEAVVGQGKAPDAKPK